MVTKKESSKTTTKKYYFARTAANAAVLWNPDKNAPWAEFDKFGLFVTTDKEAAQAILDAGYYQVTEAQIKARNLPLPTGDLPSLSYQPGAPGRGYNQPKPLQAGETTQEADLDNPQGFATETEFPEGPDPAKPGEKRTLR